MFQKSFSVIMLMVLCSYLHGGVSINQNFENFTIGSLGTTGQGSDTSIGGKWWAIGTGTDPSIVVDPCNPNNKCVRITGEGAQLKVRSNADPILTDTPFIISFSVWPKSFIDGGYTYEGAFYLYCDNSSNINPLNPDQGIAMYTATSNYAWLYDAEMLNWRTIGLDLSKSINSWADIKIHVKTWNDGTYGRYDVWYNANKANGWERVALNNAFSPALLHSPVNAILFRPRTPPSSGILDYFDNVHITTVPLDCQESILFNGEMAGDYDFDCQVNSDDLKLFTSNWLKSRDIVWQHKWDCNEVPLEAEGGNLWRQAACLTPVGTAANGIYSASSGAYMTASGLYDCNLPVLLEFRHKPISVKAGGQWTAMICLYDSDIQNYIVDYFRPGRYPADPQGWTTFRVLTYLDSSNNLDHGELYYLDQNNKWKLGTHMFLTNSSNLTSDFYFGAGASTVGGTWEEDYFYFTQDPVSIENFLTELVIQKIDENDDRIDFKDFCQFSSKWLNSLNF